MDLQVGLTVIRLRPRWNWRGDQRPPDPPGHVTRSAGPASAWVSAARMASPRARATGGGKALPTCRYAAVFRPENSHQSGKPCSRATIRTVSLGRWSTGNKGPGAESPMPSPSTPSPFHASRARVGPRSGPPCFLLPPTIVGAIPQALAAQSVPRASPPRPSGRPASPPPWAARPPPPTATGTRRPTAAARRPARTGAAAGVPRAGWPDHVPPGLVAQVSQPLQDLGPVAVKPPGREPPHVLSSTARGRPPRPGAAPAGTGPARRPGQAACRRWRTAGRARRRRQVDARKSPAVHVGHVILDDLPRVAPVAAQRLTGGVVQLDHGLVPEPGLFQAQGLTTGPGADLQGGQLAHRLPLRCAHTTAALPPSSFRRLCPPAPSVRLSHAVTPHPTAPRAPLCRHHEASVPASSS